MSDLPHLRATFTNPVAGFSLGDPFVLRWRGRFYLYGTNDGPPLADLRQIPVFVSDDLLNWQALGGALEPLEPALDHWAPEVLAWNGRFFMVVSFGDVEERGHELWIAVADQPEGPFRLTKRISDPSEAFSIDGSWLLDDDGRLYLFRCLDFVQADDPPHGTGIVVQPMHDPLTPFGRPRTVLRAHSDWHRFEIDRVMPLYEGQTFPTWTTIEGPAPVRRAGRVFCGYSGGNYLKAYGTGEVVADSPLGPYEDLRGWEGPLFMTTPGLIEGPGHFSVVRPDLVSDWIVLHGRVPGESGRRVWLCPVVWNRDGINIGPLTDLPQAPPPLPLYVGRFDGIRTAPPGWRIETGRWRQHDGELQTTSPAGELALIWLEEPARLPERWVIEVHVRFLGESDTEGEAGIALASGATQWRISLQPSTRRCVLTREGEELTAFLLPTLGDDPFEPSRYHVLEARLGDNGLQIRLDGVFLGLVSVEADASFQVGLFASAQAAFDGVSITDAAQA